MSSRDQADRGGPRRCRLVAGAVQGEHDLDLVDSQDAPRALEDRLTRLDDVTPSN